MDVETYFVLVLGFWANQISSAHNTGTKARKATSPNNFPVLNPESPIPSGHISSPYESHLKGILHVGIRFCTTRK